MSRDATGALVAEAWATGAWLGGTQATLGFALMAGAGPSVTLFLLFVALWLCGGAIGAALGRERLVPALLGAAGVATIVARWGLRAWPMSDAATVAGLATGLAAGAYAGAYLSARAPAWPQVRRLLLHENNGSSSGTSRRAWACSSRPSPWSCRSRPSPRRSWPGRRRGRGQGGETWNVSVGARRNEAPVRFEARASRAGRGDHRTWMFGRGGTAMPAPTWKLGCGGWL